MVAPRAGAWIETMGSMFGTRRTASHPVRVRGLKLLYTYQPRKLKYVAPRAGAWIETPVVANTSGSPVVAPRAGAWIETHCIKKKGLKIQVAPRAGAWIETKSYPTFKIKDLGRTPCGCVD